MPETSVLDPAPVKKRAIRNHYDMATPFYRLLWGTHIHHGLWDADESPALAQRRLIERMIKEAGVQPGSRVLDVGCGMGGSSIYLARRLGCEVTGLTLSPVQRAWASATAWLTSARRRTQFACQDVEEAHFASDSFDVIWSIECTEHLFDKRRFFERAGRWLRPGGCMAICAWLAAHPPHTADVRRQVRAVCEGFLCPSLGSADDYLGWMRGAGMTDLRFIDLTDQVARTWEICRERVRRTGVKWLAQCVGRDAVAFLDHFQTILHAYRSGAMRYGCLVGSLASEG